VVSDPTWVHLTCRLISAACGTLTLVVVYKLAKALFDLTTAVVGAALLAVAFLHVRDSHFGVLDVPLTLLIMTSVRLLVTAWQRDHATHLFALAGACGGLATSLKYNAAVLLVAALVTAALKAIDSPSERRLAPVAGFMIFLVAFAACFVVGTPYALLDRSAFMDGVSAHAVRLSEGHGLRINQAWLRHLTFSLRHGLSLPILIAAIAGIAVLAVRNWRKATIVCCFPVVYFAVIGSGHTAFVRYTTPLVPFLCITAALAVRELVDAVAGRRQGRFQVAVVTLAAALAAWPTLATVVRFNSLLTQRDTRLLASDWLAANMLPKQRLYESGWIYVHPHYAWAPGAVDFVALKFDQPREVWLTSSGQEASPEWIVVAESPLRLFTPVSPELRSRIAAEYRLVQRFSGTREPESEAWFDRQDAFFLRMRASAPGSGRVRTCRSIGGRRRRDHAHGFELVPRFRLRQTRNSGHNSQRMAWRPEGKLERFWQTHD